ncbi:MAG: hypothetical protein ACPG32_02785 [Akkermansiaceae bacterium]
MKTIYLTLASLMLSLSLAQAQNQNQPDPKTNGSGNTSESENPHRRFWQASLPGGSYVVALDRISSISKHSYIIDGGLRVTEVVIDTNGNSLVRFYYIIPVSEDSGSSLGSGLTQRGKELLDKAGERTGANGNTAVAKQYPTTTHSKTVEFRISHEGDLDKLMGSVQKAWITGRGKRFSIKQK